MEYKSLRHSQVILDPENPRLPDGTSSDKEAINRLLSEGYEQLLALARDMVEQGESNPTELPIVVKEGSKYLVLEGNRRFAALKLLADPRLADDAAHRAAFTRLRAKGRAPLTIPCAIARDRDDTDHWIMLRHTGANDGVGVRRWSAAQTATHRRRMKASVDSGTLRSLAIADELTEAYQADDRLVDLIMRVRAEKLTNIGRFFSTGVLTRMQFEIRQLPEGDSRGLWVRHTAELLRPFFTWAMEFLNGNSVDAFKNDELRDALLNMHGQLLPDPAESLPDLRRLANHPYSPEESDAGAHTYGDEDPTSRSGSEPGMGADDEESADDEEAHSDDDETGGLTSRGGRERDPRPERYLYSGVKLTNLGSNVRRLLKEAKALPIDGNYGVACVLARVILELTVSDDKVVAWSQPGDDRLATRIRACIIKLEPLMDNPMKRTRKDLEQAHLETKEIGVRYMHQFMHNPHMQPSPEIARKFSRAYSPLLNSINEAVK